VARTAEIVRGVVRRAMPEKGDIPVVTTPSDDPRSYHICCEKIRRELGFVPRRTVEDGAGDLVEAFRAGRLPGAMTDIHYYNIKMMKEIRLK
jgi:nucleoside-diphosphate-sugar epimerase